jgi:hypothetical protein
MTKPPVHILAIATAAALLLAGCETTNSENWARGHPSVPFSEAEATGEGETAQSEDEENRPEFFAGCMGVLGWRPTQDSTFANSAAAPDPS